jgi:YegS/Rv2252/BmrU family lipid kinase
LPRYRLIVNPVAGRGTGERAVPEVQGYLDQLDLDYDIVRTEAPWHGAELARQAVVDGCEIVVSMGGDGVANEVLNGLVGANRAGLGSCAMGVLCAGRGNDFAYGVGIPQPLADGCQVLAEGHRRTIDIGSVEGGNKPGARFFGNGVGVGFDAVVGFEAVKMKRLSGFPSYIVAVIKTVFLYYHAPLVEVSCDGESSSGRLLLVSVMNGQRMGGGFYMAPDGQPDDGLFDLCVGTEVSRAGIFRLIPHFLRGTQDTQDPISTRRARKVVVTAIDGTLPAHADGETLCEGGQRLAMELLPSQLEMVCPARRGRP